MSSLEGDCSVMKNDILLEFEDRELRRDNLMIFGLPEPSESHTTIEEERLLDRVALDELFGYMNVDNDLEILKVNRLGKPSNGKPRPLKVRFAFREQRNRVLGKSRVLRSISRYRNVYINSDKTKLEQQQWLQLQRDLKARRTRGEDVHIFNGKIRSNGLRNFRN